jgi:RNA polymerase sigma-70 factor (ECF subfamily)
MSGSALNFSPALRHKLLSIGQGFSLKSKTQNEPRTALAVEISLMQLDIRQIADVYFSRIHRTALVLSGNPWDADDLAQETFLVLARNANQFRGGSSIYTWLYGILLNLDRGHRRRCGARRQKLRAMWMSEIGSLKSMPPADAPAEMREWKQTLWAQVAELPLGQRDVLVLRFSEHLQYEEIAEVLGCPLGTVKSHVTRGRARLLQALGGPDDGR